MGTFARSTPLGAKFRRQVRIGETNYVVDFCCIESRLIIEIDGEIHVSQEAADVLRQSTIEALGFRFLRFSSEDVRNHLGSVLQTIRNTLSPP